MAQNWRDRGGQVKAETGNISFQFKAMHENVILLENYLAYLSEKRRIVLQVENLR